MTPLAEPSAAQPWRRVRTYSCRVPAWPQCWASSRDLCRPPQVTAGRDEGLGAPRSRSALGHVVMASPGRFLCFVRHQVSEPDAACACWQRLTGWEPVASPTHEEFRQLVRPPSHPLQGLLQRLGEGAGSVRASLDLTTTDRLPRRQGTSPSARRCWSSHRAGPCSPTPSGRRTASPTARHPGRFSSVVGQRTPQAESEACSGVLCSRTFPLGPSSHALVAVLFWGRRRKAEGCSRVVKPGLQDHQVVAVDEVHQPVLLADPA